MMTSPRPKLRFLASWQEINGFRAVPGSVQFAIVNSADIRLFYQPLTSPALFQLPDGTPYFPRAAPGFAA
jgi:hypothetical protein